MREMLQQPITQTKLLGMLRRQGIGVVDANLGGQDHVEKWDLAFRPDAAVEIQQAIGVRMIQRSEVKHTRSANDIVAVDVGDGSPTFPFRRLVEAQAIGVAEFIEHEAL